MTREFGKKKVRNKAEIEAYKYYDSSDEEFEPYVELLIKKRHKQAEEFDEKTEAGKPREGESENHMGRI